MPAAGSRWCPVTRTAREAVESIAGGSPEVMLIVPGWLHSSELRRPVFWQVRQTAFTLQTGAVHSRWAWLRETWDGEQQTAFLIWPCQTLHRLGFQCWNGRLTRGGMRFPGRIPLPAPEQ